MNSQGKTFSKIVSMAFNTLIPVSIRSVERPQILISILIIIIFIWSKVALLYFFFFLMSSISSNLIFEMNFQFRKQGKVAPN